MALLEKFNPADEQGCLAYFNLCHDEIESHISSDHLKNEESYVGHGLTAEALYTSFADYHQMLTHPLVKSDDIFIDVGAGLCKGSLLAGAIGLKTNVLSLELVAERVEAAKNSARSKGQTTEGYIVSDLLQESLPKGNHYFIYLPTGILLSKVIAELKELAKSEQFYVWCIESHGDLVATLLNLAPGLELYDQCELRSSIRHDQTLYIFKSSKKEQYEREKFPFQNQICQHQRVCDQMAQIVVEDRDLGSEHSYLWLADTKGLSMGVREAHLQAHYPDREFPYRQVREILPTPPEEFSFWVWARRSEKVFSNLGQVRKIIISPTKTIEFSVAGRIPLSEAQRWQH